MDLRRHAVPLALLLLCFAALPAAAFKSASRGEIPAASDNYVNDYAGVLSPEQARTLSDKLERVELDTGIEITVVTVKRLATYGAGDAEVTARLFFNTWGVGNRKRNDGILVLVAVEDRRMAIEVGDGWGTRLKGSLGEIIRDEFAPRFRTGRYGDGIREGTLAIVELVTRPAAWYERRWVQNLGLMLGILLCLAIAVSCFREGRSGWGFAFLAAALALVVLLLQNNRSRGSSGSFGGGFSSGGGGASGGW